MLSSRRDCLNHSLTFCCISGTVRKWLLPKPLEPSSGRDLTGLATQIFGYTNAGGDDEEDEDEEDDADSVMSWAAKWGKVS